MGNPCERGRDYIHFELRGSLGLSYFPKLLPHTKRAEHPVEHVLDVHRSYQLFERTNRCPEVNRGNGSWKLLFRPCGSELIDLRTGGANRLSMTGSGEDRQVRSDLPMSLIQHSIDRCKQTPQSRAALRA